MPMSEYARKLREKVGSDLLMVPAVAAVIRNEEHQVLLVLRADDKVWDLPAGLIDPGETPATAVVRELREETGLQARPVRLLGVLGGQAYRHTYPDGNRTEPLIVVFACERFGGELHPQPEEVSRLGWFDPGALPEMLTEYPDWVWQVHADAGFQP